MSTTAKNYIAEVEQKTGMGFLKKRPDGVYVFNGYNPKTQNVRYAHYVLDECCICEKEHFRRRQPKHRNENAHLLCHLIMVKKMNI